MVGAGPARALAGSEARFGRASNPFPTFNLVRARDMLALSFEVHNLELKRKGQAGPGDTQTARLVRTVPDRPAYIVVVFEPQHLAEHAFFEVNDPMIPGDPGPETLMSPPVPSSLAGPSRLAFRVPANVAAVPFELDTLLTWGDWERSLAPLAQDPPRSGAGFRDPTVFTTDTALEVPWRLYLSPGPSSLWFHSHDPVTHTDPKDSRPRTELWHSRMGVHIGSASTEGGRIANPHNEEGGPLRAIWTPGFSTDQDPPDPNGLGPNPPERTSLKPNDRWQIVRLTAERDLQLFNQDTAYVPQPVDSDRFALSALGVFMDTKGAWPKVTTQGGVDHPWVSDLVKWDHRAAIGRDNYVRVIHSGYLLPFGHAAVVVTVTERKMQPAESGPLAGQLGGYLRQHAFIIPRRFTLGYPAASNQPNGARDFPFTNIKLKTLVTPNLEPYDGATPVTQTQVLKTNSQPYGSAAFWPMIPSSGGTPVDFEFVYEATDRDGNSIQFTAPQIFVSSTLADDKTKQDDIEQIIHEYGKATPSSRHTRSFNGQKVAFATFPGGEEGATAYEVDTMTFSAAPPVNTNAEPTDIPRFFPNLLKADVRLQAAERIAGKSLAKKPTIVYHDTYVANGQNNSKVFAMLVDSSTVKPPQPGKAKTAPTPEPLDMVLGADTSGGVLTPNMAITGLSAALGPMGGDLSSGLPSDFDPLEFFGNPASLPKILGGLDLWDIIHAVTGFSDLDKIPKTIESPLPDQIVVSLEWNPEPVHDPLHVFVPGGNCSISISAVSTTEINDNGTPGESTFEITGIIEDFQAQLVGDAFKAIVITFDHLSFSSVSGQKPNVDPAITDVTFVGVLEFVQKLQEFLSSIGFGNGGLSPGPATRNGALVSRKAQAADAPEDDGSGPSITVDETGINASLGVSLPAIQVGVFSLEGISFGAKLNIPFVDGPARVRFNFASQDAPFLITVSLFGGGGSVEVGLGLDGFESLTLTLEFGAKIAIDLGVASGGISVMGGIYINIEDNNGNQDTTLTGFVKMTGELDVLGLITASVEFDLSLTYEDSGGVKRCYGQAEITVEVSVAFFSASVTLGPVEEEFAGGGGSAPAPLPGASSNGSRARAASVDDNHITFAQLMSQDDWAVYAASYAPGAF